MAVKTKVQPAPKAKPQPKAPPVPKAQPAPKAKAQPKAKPVAEVVEEEQEAKISATERRYQFYDAVEGAADAGKPLTVQQVFQSFGEFGLSRLGKLLCSGSYVVEGAPVPPKLSADKAAARVERLEFAKQVLAKRGKSRISVLTKARRRQSA